MPMYQLTCQLAALEPPPPLMQALFEALRGNGEGTDRYLATIAGTLSIPELDAPDNVLRIIAGAGAASSVAGIVLHRPTPATASPLLLKAACQCRRSSTRHGRVDRPVRPAPKDNADGQHPQRDGHRADDESDLDGRRAPRVGLRQADHD